LTSEPLTAISEDVRALIAQEPTNARAELSGEARTASKGMITLGVEGALRGLSAGAATVVPTGTLAGSRDSVRPAAAEQNR
jgi:hypothetical protein